MRALVRAEGKRASNIQMVEAEIDEMAANLRSAENSAAASGSGILSTLGLTLFQEKRYLRPLLVGMSLMLFQQVGLMCVVTLMLGGREGRVGEDGWGSV